MDIYKTVYVLPYSTVYLISKGFHLYVNDHKFKRLIEFIIKKSNTFHTLIAALQTKTILNILIVAILVLCLRVNLLLWVIWKCKPVLSKL